MRDKHGNQLSGGDITKKVLNRLFNIALEFEIFILHCVGYLPSHLVREWFYLVAGIKIGSGSTIHMGATFYDPRNISIGNDTIVGEHAVLDGRDKLRIGNHVDIASEVMIYNSQHNIHSETFESISAPVIVEDYVFIGPRAIILPGVILKKGSVVGAGAVVTKDVDEYTIVGGVPAVVIGKRKVTELTYQLGRARWFR